MNTKIVRYILSRMLMIEALLLVPSLLISFYFGESFNIKKAYFITIGLLLLVGTLLGIKSENTKRFYAKEGMITVALAWILLSFFGALPFVFSGEIPSLIDAFFEASSGFTTTGASILTDVEAMSKSMLFWRSFTHLVGGMGILVFALAILPETTEQTAHLMKAEVPGPTFGKLVSKASTNSRILYKIYFAMTLILIIILRLEGMPLFDSCVNAFGTAGTGGFAIKSNSIAAYHSSLIEMTIAVGMLLFGLNFNLYYMSLVGRFKDARKSEEARVYLGIVLVTTILIFINLNPVNSPLTKLKDAFFSVSSIITTTGYSTADFGKWPLFSQGILLLLMFIGGCAGSTAGGFKVSRLIILFKSGIREIRRSVNPKRVLALRFEGKGLDKNVTTTVKDYFIVYVGCIILLTFLVTTTAPDFFSAFSAVATAFNNIGPGLGVFGPSSSFASLSDFNKVLLSFAMLAGRLEIFPIIILLAPSTWRNR